MKVLEYAYEQSLAPSGGPSGYLYNIACEAKRRGDDTVCFLEPSRRRRAMDMLKKLSPSIARLVARNVKGEGDYEKTTIDGIRYAFRCSSSASIRDFRGYNAVHFHTTRDLFSCKTALEGYHGKVILTSHSPCVSCREIIDDCIAHGIYERNKVLIDSCECMDEFAFSRADAVIFPSPGAEEPYYHTWEKYPEIRGALSVKYLETGTLRAVPKRTREEVRQSLGIPDDAFVVSFTGRHNDMKGYDFLTEIFPRLGDVYVVCCGKPSDVIPAPHSERWIEIGWTDDPHSYVAASDLFVLPNKETYFDLALLQTLSIGKACLISATGGNKGFSNREDAGIYLYETKGDFVNRLCEIRAMRMSVAHELEDAQRRLFAQKYTVEVFFDSYLRILSDIVDGD